DYSRCINCLCCMEVCPHAAFYQDRSLMYRFTSLFSRVLK
ncbi:MAG: 4Fe-4S binding protein, partial [Methanothermobacter sp.]|nr:4Fe-4S binding protein [Methanothermobacter sp.]